MTMASGKGTSTSTQPQEKDIALAELRVADSHFLGFCFDSIQNKNDVDAAQDKLRSHHPTAAHIPVVWCLPDGSKGVDEDDEPEDSIRSAVMEAFDSNTSVRKENNGSTGYAVVIVRYFGTRLLGVTCGRLPQCYRSIVRLTLHRHFSGKEEPHVLEEINFPNTSIYGLAAGDTELILNVVEEDDIIVDKIIDELDFDGFRGAKGEVLPRLQNLQADISEQVIPVYRYPGNYHGDEWATFEWSPTSLKIKHAVEESLKPLVHQEMNHCVTNYYRDGKDFIAHHSDKDLDLNRDGVIVSVSLGDERILELRRRANPKDVTRILLPHRSMLVLGPITNKEFTHSILQREGSSKARISLTMRNVLTFKDLKSRRLFGQGAHAKLLRDVRGVQMIQNLSFFGGFCALSSFMVGNRRIASSMGTCVALAGLFATASLSFRFISEAVHRRREEKAARDFFSKTSVSGTKY